jgi:hypothetical protein
MFGRCPDGAGWACAGVVTRVVRIGPAAPTAAAASVVPPKRTLRRLGLCFLSFPLPEFMAFSLMVW